MLKDILLEAVVSGFFLPIALVLVIAVCTAVVLWLRKRDRESWDGVGIGRLSIAVITVFLALIVFARDSQTDIVITVLGEQGLPRDDVVLVVTKSGREFIPDRNGHIRVRIETRLRGTKATLRDGNTRRVLKVISLNSQEIIL